MSAAVYVTNKWGMMEGEKERENEKSITKKTVTLAQLEHKVTGCDIIRSIEKWHFQLVGLVCSVLVLLSNRLAAELSLVLHSQYNAFAH